MILLRMFTFALFAGVAIAFGLNSAVAVVVGLAAILVDLWCNPEI